MQTIKFGKQRRQRVHDDILCTTCTDLKLTVDDFLGYQRNGMSNRRETFHRIFLPSSNIIWARRRCPLCRLLIAALVESNADRPEIRKQLENGIECALEWRKDGRALVDAPHGSRARTPSTRRLRVFSPGDGVSDAYLLLAAQPGFDTIQNRFLGRQVEQSSVDLHVLHDWLTDCSRNHGDNCRSTGPDIASEYFQDLPFRLIDVETRSIVRGIRGPFIALSYVWGPGAHESTLRSTIRDLSLLGGLKRVPRTVEDAMWLTRRLGQRFLWVDRYCIMQDDAEDKSSMIAGMDLVYSAALLTICAADGDAEHGISGLSDDRQFSQTIEAYSQDIQLMVSHPTEFYIRKSGWNNRAWTFQERICSKRCLIFVDGRAFFQCRQSTLCEDIHMEGISSLDGAQGWSLEQKDSPVRLFSENPLRQYTKSVQLYTERKLTYSADKLNAFSAILKLLSANLMSDFFGGLPTAYFDFALLWTQTVPSERVSGFPSWSWCGWVNSIEYRYNTLEGVLINLHEWLASRTWIIWYSTTNNAERTIRPVWDGKRNGVAGRWKGYERFHHSDLYGHTESETRDLSASSPSQVVLSDREMLCDPEFHLRFHTHSSFFKLSSKATSDSTSSSPGPGIKWFDLSDAAGDWCGTVLLDKSWAAHTGYTSHEFIAISEARDFSMEEHDSWTFYVPRDRVDSQWDLYHVMLISTTKNGVSERVGLGKVFKDAFTRSLEPGYSWKEILLG